MLIFRGDFIKVGRFMVFVVYRMVWKGFEVVVESCFLEFRASFVFFIIFIFYIRLIYRVF